MRERTSNWCRLHDFFVLCTSGTLELFRAGSWYISDAVLAQHWSIRVSDLGACACSAIDYHMATAADGRLSYVHIVHVPPCVMSTGASTSYAREMICIENRQRAVDSSVHHARNRSGFFICTFVNKEARASKRERSNHTMAHRASDQSLNG